jgi:hypothetical protein
MVVVGPSGIRDRNSGVSLGWDEIVRRPSRPRRLRGWATEWAIGIGVAIPILALIIWLGG